MRLLNIAEWSTLYYLYNMAGIYESAFFDNLTCKVLVELKEQDPFFEEYIVAEEGIV